MSVIHQIDFTTGPVGASITPANTPGFNGPTTGAAPIFSDDIPQLGEADYSMSLDVDAASYNNAVFSQTQALIWVGMYLKVINRPTSGSAYWFINIGDGHRGGGITGDYYFSTGGEIGFRDHFGGTILTPPLVENQWYRLAFKANPGSTTGARIKLYTGADLHTMSPTWDSGDLDHTTTNGTYTSSIRIGLTSGDLINTNYHLYRVRVDNAVEPDPIPAPPPTTVSTHYRLNSSGVWVPAEAVLL